MRFIVHESNGVSLNFMVSVFVQQKQKERKRLEKMEKEKQNPTKNEEVVIICVEINMKYLLLFTKLVVLISKCAQEFAEIKKI